MESFVSIDMFGHPVGVNYKGSEAYRTKVGALFSIIAYMIIGTYFGERVYRLVKKDQPDKASLIEVLNMNSPDAELSFEQGQFDFAIGLNDMTEFIMTGEIPKL